MEQKTDVNKTGQKLNFVSLPEMIERVPIADLFGLKIWSKTIVLLAGQSTAGKTVTCLHFADRCIDNNKDVLYIDTDGHPAMTRPMPNLLLNLINANKEKYDKHFHYSNEFNEDAILNAIDQIKPTLVVIDSIYKPYAECNHPMLRAQKIRQYIYKLRDKLLNGEFAIMLTSQISKTREEGGLLQNILGGEGLKHLSDTKWILDFVTDADKETRRLLLIDKQIQAKVLLGYGGSIEEIDGLNFNTKNQAKG